MEKTQLFTLLKEFPQNKDPGTVGREPGRASLPAHPPRFLGLDGKSCTNQWKKTPRLLLGGKKRLSRK